MVGKAPGISSVKSVSVSIGIELVQGMLLGGRRVGKFEWNGRKVSGRLHQRNGCFKWYALGKFGQRENVSAN